MSSEQGLIMLVQQYAAKFGITFSSSLMDNEEYKARLLVLMAEAISGKRGPVTDEDVTGA
ncbi:hypothetical protein SAMN05192560_2163 [Methylobacillus rhizosphaerae]|uniref:Uncharacterized protein n=1 Tax=Methylobacillus rhizosphaerae TaxID=551994 RepID=A0A239AW70_9PROT|nr:hypothetical protein [Methylobacillus rhizosphaerae]SNR99955.1 hypothetical protein SAMN05192560_2163 [Methylobacillus rhizosphaerae]